MSMLGGRGGRTRIRAPRKNLVGANADLDFEETWNTLAGCLRQMHTKNASQLSFEEIYRHAYKIVLRKKGEDFYDRLQTFEEKWLNTSVRSTLDQELSPMLLTESSSQTDTSHVNERRAAGEVFLRGLRNAFEDHQQVMNMATDVFMYLDRVFCQDNRRPSIYTSAMLLFTQIILRSPVKKDAPTLLAILTRVILDQIAMERDGDIIDKTLIKSCVRMLEGLYETASETEEQRLYLTCFEAQLLSESRQFFANEATKMLATSDAAAYCQHTRKRIREEADRCRSTLSETTEAKLVKVVEEELIQNKIRDLIFMESGVKYMIDHDNVTGLHSIYELNARIDKNKVELTNAIRRRVQEVGNDINTQANDPTQAQAAPSAAATEQDDADSKAKSAPKVNPQITSALQWVTAVLNLKNKFDRLWQDSFEGDPIIQPALTKSFREFINSLSRSSEFISLFIDDNMKKGLKDKTEKEVDEVLERAITLLRYIDDKDMFERYYKKHLCKRLLMGKSVSIDVEKQMISRMKIELGNAFTSKMEAMFKDMTLSDELTNGYRTRAEASADKRAELSIHVLTSQTWPLETMQQAINEDEHGKRCIFPAEIERIRKGFENFYQDKHSGRRLTWLPHMGTADIRATFPAVQGGEGRLAKERRHELNVSTYCMIILILFNDLPRGSGLTFSDIETRTNIPHAELVRNLQSLAVAPKSRVLIKTPMSKDIKPNDVFTFNDKFTAPYMKIKVGVVAAGNRVEGEKERKETQMKNDEQRGFMIEAAVVRIMKQRKEMTHQKLMTETLSQLSSRFKPDVTMVKKRIESLIEREYLERKEESSPAAYRYLA